MNAYERWIAEFLAWRNPLGACEVAVKAMVLSFTELRRVRGHYHCASWGKRAHWWCVDPDGRIVDPTVTQFPSSHFPWRDEFYEPWDEASGPPPIPCKCYWCGMTWDIPGDSTVIPMICSPECNDAAVADLNRDLAGA